MKHHHLNHPKPERDKLSTVDVDGMVMGKDSTVDADGERSCGQLAFHFCFVVFL
jgi:hypothetical protein